MHHVEEADDEVETRGSIRSQLQATTWADGRPMFTTASLISLLLFYIYALQCLPTSAVVARETGSWKWAIGQFPTACPCDGAAKARSALGKDQRR